MRPTATAALLLFLFGVGVVTADDTKPGPAPSSTPAPGGWSAGTSDDMTPIPFDSVTTARYRRTALALAAAMGTGDAKALRALHTDAGWAQADDWWKGMLATQQKKYGRVVRAVGPLRGTLRMGNTGLGVPRDGAAVLLLFEKPLGASMSFTLDAEGKIVTSNTWVQQELAQVNTEGAEVLWEADSKGARR